MIDFIANKKPLFTPDEIDFGGDFGKLITFTSHYTFDRNFSVSFKVRDLTGTCIHKDGEFKFDVDSNGADDKDMMFHPRAWLFELAEMMSYFDFNENSHVKKIAVIGFGMNIVLEPFFENEFDRGRYFGRFNKIRIENKGCFETEYQCAYMYQIRRLIFTEFDYVGRNITVHREFKNRNFDTDSFELNFRDEAYSFYISNGKLGDSIIDTLNNSKSKQLVLTFLSDWCDVPEVITVIENEIQFETGNLISKDTVKLLYIMFKSRLSKHVNHLKVVENLEFDDILVLKRLSYYLPSGESKKINDVFEIYSGLVVETRLEMSYKEALDKVLKDTEPSDSTDRFTHKIMFDGGWCSKEYNILKLHLDYINKENFTEILSWFEKINTEEQGFYDDNGEWHGDEYIGDNYRLYFTLDNYYGELYVSYKNKIDKDGKELYLIRYFTNFNELSVFGKYKDVFDKFNFRCFGLNKNQLVVR